MTSDFVIFLILGAISGGFVNGLIGSGTALFALGFYLTVLDPVTAVAIVALMSVLAGLQGLWLVRKEILAQPRRLLRFLLPGLAGVPIGISILSIIDSGVLRLGISGLLILYGAYFGFRSALPSYEKRTPVLDAGIGFTGGVLGGSASVSGALPTMWLSIRPWSKAETRAVLQPYNIAILSTTVCLLAFGGAYDRTALNALLITVPVGVLAAQAGIFVFRKLSDLAFRRLLILLSFAMGLGILVSEVS